MPIEGVVKNVFFSKTKPIEKRILVRKVFVWASLVGLALYSQAAACYVSPNREIKQFFDFLTGAEVEKAANMAVFSNDQEKTLFTKTWSQKAKSLSGYEIEEWEIESRKGSAAIVLESNGSDEKIPMKVGLLRQGTSWHVVPEEDFDFGPPASDSPKVVENLEDLVNITSATRGSQISLSVESKAPFSVLFRFDMDLPEVLQPDHSLPLQGILPPTKGPIPLCNLTISGEVSYRYSWRYTVKRVDDEGEMVPPGVLTPLPAVPVLENSTLFVGEKYAYGLPYPSGQSYVIWQGPGGEFSHSEPGSRYAVDLSMPLDSEIAAARSGVVIGVIEKNPDNPGEEPGPASMANEILVLHADGTIAVYAHLTTDGARVSFGQIVRRGQTIGLSGNSGYSRGAHLHFDVLSFEGGRCRSTPFRFLSVTGPPIVPRRGLILFADPSGAASITDKETTPWRVIHKSYSEYDTEILYFARTIEFLAANKTKDPIGVELSFSRLENVKPVDELPRRIALLADGTFRPVLGLELITLGKKSSFTYVFRRVEPPGMEHIPLRVERDGGKGYVIEVRYFSDRIEFYAENKIARPMAGSLEFSSLRNVLPRERTPVRIDLPSGASAHYLATLHIQQPTRGYSFQYNIGSPSRK